MSGEALRVPGLGAPALRGPRDRTAARERTVFWVILAAIVSQLTISGNILTWLGVPYNTPGGLPLVKFHVGTYLAVLAVLLQARMEEPVAPRMIARIAASPGFPLGVALMALCALYALLDVGMSGTAIYIESYASAALLGFALERQSPRNLRLIGYAMLAAFVLNTLICIGETVLQSRLVPIILVFNTEEIGPLPEWEGEFRGTALYDSPLAGAMMTMMAVFLCLAADLKPAAKTCILGVLMVGLITFGGRTALALTYVVLACLGAGDVVRRLIRRRLTARRAAAAAAALIAIPAALAFILFETSLGERIAGKFYADDSAAVRLVQWSILGEMDVRDLLFGMSGDHLEAVMRRIGLNPPFNDIESFWLLCFVSLGLTGFAIWLSGLAVILHRLWRERGPHPKLILICVLIVASSSNSLGRKSNILFIAVAAIMSAAAFSAGPRAAPAIPKPALRPAAPPAMRPAARRPPTPFANRSPRPHSS